MPNVLILCDHAEQPSPSDQFDQVHKVDQYGSVKNMRLGASHISHYLLSPLNPVARDLLDIAAFIYHADGSVSRGTERDLFNEKWVRNFTFAIPVRRPDIWQQQSVRTALIEMLQYLSEDRFEFVFTQREALPEQLVFKEIGKELPPCPEADCVALFSGGMDSLGGAVHLAAQGHKPLLVSHQSRSVMAALQKNLALPLRERFSWEFPQLGIWINRAGLGIGHAGLRAIENSQRSRSFLFLALGSLLARELKLDRLIVCENGITTFNLPRLGQVVGAQATRSTHPYFVRRFQDLASEVFGVDFTIEIPFVWKTRSQVIDILKENRCEDLVLRPKSWTGMKVTYHV
jgi:hypothetical protein